MPPTARILETDQAWAITKIWWNFTSLQRDAITTPVQHELSQWKSYEFRGI
ncbi:hypothetical protein KCP76_18710 [Salmonella enterica subsp. enterica serovar Weltevreden]|nr:hypothetical protein KCP76_18710 [Salmonella enterica subsp. enterica serovar Weltevreden]